eukprot:gb/GECG01015723.1/.p1 GENE.gb/GECG01015723.1/~~gb/GECG01015723.1/.p1  ORF type:complete len:139 (+),score=7.03 gb/GECG01015723.1/:1-417(+)
MNVCRLSTPLVSSARSSPSLTLLVLVFFVYLSCRPGEHDESMADLFKDGHIQDMVVMVNKPPKWNEYVGAYVLNFSGRVTMASVKNFQLVTPEDHDRVILQFGRTAKDLFTMDVRWPLSPLQAFGICVSSFDYKLACD